MFLFTFPLEDLFIRLIYTLPVGGRSTTVFSFVYPHSFALDRFLQDKHAKYSGGVFIVFRDVEKRQDLKSWLRMISCSL